MLVSTCCQWGEGIVGAFSEFCEYRCTLAPKLGNSSDIVRCSPRIPHPDIEWLPRQNNSGILPLVSMSWAPPPRPRHHTATGWPPEWEQNVKGDGATDMLQPQPSSGQQWSTQSSSVSSPYLWVKYLLSNLPCLWHLMIRIRSTEFEVQQLLYCQTQTQTHKMSM